MDVETQAQMRQVLADLREVLRDWMHCPFPEEFIQTEWNNNNLTDIMTYYNTNPTTPPLPNHEMAAMSPFSLSLKNLESILQRFHIKKRQMLPNYSQFSNPNLLETIMQLDPSSVEVPQGVPSNLSNRTVFPPFPPPHCPCTSETPIAMEKGMIEEHDREREGDSSHATSPHQSSLAVPFLKGSLFLVFVFLSHFFLSFFFNIVLIAELNRRHACRFQ